jgi:hypothetical protein
MANKYWGRGKTLRLNISAICLMAFMFFGYDQGVFSGILQNKNWLEQFDYPVNLPSFMVLIFSKDRALTLLSRMMSTRESLSRVIASVP